MKTSENLSTKLTEGVKTLNTLVNTASSATKDELDTWAKDLDKSIEQGRQSAEDFGAEIESVFSESVETIRQRFEAVSEKAAGEKADLGADWADLKAKAAIRIALEAIQFAQKAVLEAVKAKAKATFGLK